MCRRADRINGKPVWPSRRGAGRGTERFGDGVEAGLEGLHGAKQPPEELEGEVRTRLSVRPSRPLALIPGLHQEALQAEALPGD